MIQSISKAVRQVVSKIWPNKKYNRINWQNRPSTATALGATNLNKIDVFCNDVDNALIQMDAGKLNIETANSMLASVSFDSKTGKFTFKELDGTTYEYDLNLEKIPVSFTLSEDGILTMTTEDGTEWTCNIADLIKDYVFDDSDTIIFEKEFVEEDDEGKGSYHVTASIKAGSINETHLNPDYRSDILTYTTQAQTAANDSLTYSKDSKRWAVGDAEYEGSATDNAKYYKEQAEAAKQAAEEARDEAQAATGTVIATTEQVGVVKPDGTTIKVDKDGTIHGANQFDGSGYTYVDGEAIDPPSTSDEAILDADKLGGQLPSYYAADVNVVKKTDISNVQADSTSTVPSSALLKSTDDKIGDTSNLPGDASDVVSAITQLNSDIQTVVKPIVETNYSSDLIFSNTYGSNIIINNKIAFLALCSRTGGAISSLMSLPFTPSVNSALFFVGQTSYVGNFDVYGTGFINTDGTLRLDVVEGGTPYRIYCVVFKWS